MSVIVNGMNLPERCEYCGFLRWYPENGNLWCNANMKLLKEGWYSNFTFKRPQTCPLEEVAEGTWEVYETADTEEEQPIAWECSRCGEVVEYKYKFCPECGSRNLL